MSPFNLIRGDFKSKMHILIALVTCTLGSTKDCRESGLVEFYTNELSNSSLQKHSQSRNKNYEHRPSKYVFLKMNKSRATLKSSLMFSVVGSKLFY